MSEHPAIGIDLGTTNSLISVWQQGSAQLIPNALNEYLTPSAVSLDEDGSILVGKPALSRLSTHPHKSASLFKRYMGTKKQFKLDNQSFDAPELSALILKSLKADAESFLGQSISDVVISVPAYFSDEQRKQTRFAAELAGLNAVRLINEPTAAAMAYGLHTQKLGRTLVFDLGGGTFDVTVLEYDLPLIEVNGSAGDNYLGGEDFTQAIIKSCLAEWKLSEQDLPAEALAQLYDSAEQLKCQLNQQNSSQQLQWQWQDQNWKFSLDEQKAERIWLPLLNRLRAPIEQALHDARLQPAELDHLVLVGGASRMSIIQKMVVKLFGKLPHQHIDPSTIVALGSAAQAACRLRNEDIEELILTDVCPYTLGIATASESRQGIFSPILERNTVVPTSKVETFYTAYAEQKLIRIAIYQGESPHIDNNIFVDAFEVPLVPTGEVQALDVRFSYDINGLLEVDVQLKGSNEKVSKVIDHSPAGLSPQQQQQSQQRLLALKIHPRDSLPNRTLLARLEKAWAQSLGDQRSQIGYWLGEFENILLSQQDPLIDPLRIQISAFLDDINL